MALKNSLSDDRGRWVLGPHAEAGSEYRMRFRTSQGARTLVMDRVFREQNNTHWIVDYKTSRHEGPTSTHSLTLTVNESAIRLNSCRTQRYLRIPIRACTFRCSAGGVNG